MNSRKTISPYTATIGSGGLLFEETDTLLPLLQSQDSQRLLKEEAANNRLLMINAVKTRRNAIGEIKRRYDNMDAEFWLAYQRMDTNDRKTALFMVILKTYKILLDFHVNVTMLKWKSISKRMTSEDVTLEMNEICARDSYVDSWTDATKKKVVGAYLTLLRRVGMLSDDGSLKTLRCGDFGFYLRIGEAWFLEACLLESYEIEKIRRTWHDHN